jgi:CRISPR-associated protein Cas1
MQRLAADDQRAEQQPVIEDEESLSAKGYAPGHRTLHIVKRNRRLGLRNQAFTVEELSEDSATGEPEWRELIAIPHDRIDRIDIGPGSDISQKAMRHIVGTGTLCSFVDGHGTSRAHIAPTLAPRAGRHLAQAKLALDPERRLELARILVMGRVRGQRALLRKMLYGRDIAPAEVLDAIAQLNKIIGRRGSSSIATADSVDVVMGYEGYAAAQYWPAISALANHSFRFAVRRRDGPLEPANIALNLLAWLLHRDVGAAVLQAGLHPGFGALHSVSDRHDACVYDLMEEFRCYFVEGLFCYVTNRRILRHDMFSRIGGTWRIKREGTAALIRAYENRMHGHARKTRGKQFSYGKLLINQAQLLAAHAECRQDYVPHIIDY